MSELYNHKYSLDNFFTKDGKMTPNLLTDYDKALGGEEKWSGKIRKREIKNHADTYKKNKKAIDVDMNALIDMIYAICQMPFKMHYNAEKSEMSLSGNTIKLDGKIKRGHTLNEAVDEVYNTIVENKGMLKQIACNYSLLLDAVYFSYHMKSKPRLYLSINDITGLKNQEFLGRKSSFRTKLMTEIMENIYFNDSFKFIRKAYGLDEEKMIRNGNLPRDYQYEKERWEKRVGYKKRS